MLTGEADRNEVAKAMDMGYVGFLDKRDVNKLPKEVIKAFARYQIDFEKQKCILGEPYHIRLINPMKNKFWTEKYDILSIKKISDVDDVIEYKDALVIDNGSEIKSSLFFKGVSKAVPSFSSEINNAITKTYKTTYSKSNSRAHHEKRTYVLNDGKDDKTIVKKVYERNPVFAEYDIVIKKTCRICGAITITSIKAYKRLPKDKTRITIYYSDGSHSRIDTDIISI